MNKVTRIKSKNFTTISNTFLKDKQLSIKGKGFLAVVMGLPDDWDFSVAGISAILKEGKGAIYTTIEELRNLGYCKYIINRDEKTKRVISTDYIFDEEPSFDRELSLRQKKAILKQGDLNSENPETANDTQLSTKGIKDISGIKNETIKEQGEIGLDWRFCFDTYKRMVDDAAMLLMHDTEFRDKMLKYYPTVDYVLTIQKSVEMFWGTEAGWENKKKSKRVQNVDMLSTLKNNFDKNKVFVPFGRTATPIPQLASSNQIGKIKKEDGWQ